MFSRACEYGIRASIFIASKSLNSERVRLRDVASEIETPEAFTAKIMQDLARCGIVKSIKGPKGGFEIEVEKLHDIKLKDIVVAIDGDQIFTGCGLGLKACNHEKPCPIHNDFASIRNALDSMLEETMLLELATQVHQGDVYLKFMGR